MHPFLLYIRVLHINLLSTISLMASFKLYVLFQLFFASLLSSSFCNGRVLLSNQSNNANITLDSLRDSLIRQEDSIVFSLIERAKFPYNAPAYSNSYLAFGGRLSIVEIFVRQSEAVQAKAGRYQNPEELPFYPNYLPSSLVPPYNFSQFLYPAAASVNASKEIWDMYFNQLLPLITTNGNDGNYALTSSSDLLCLQLLARRIHLGRFVAEVKFQSAPNDYIPAIRAKDTETLEKLVTTKSVEEMVQTRVEKKAMIFGQDVTLESNNGSSVDDGNQTMYKVDPSAVFQLYRDWVIPLTKVVEVNYLLKRLD